MQPSLRREHFGISDKHRHRWHYQQVEFFQGTTLLATFTSSPYAFKLAGVPAGTLHLAARATDNSGARFFPRRAV